MARHRKQVKAKAEEPPPRPANPFIRLLRAIEVALILLAIGYVGILLVSRTDGFRSLLADRLQGAIGLPVKIDRSHAALNLDIVLEGVNTEGDGAKSQPAVHARRVEVDWSPLRSLSGLSWAVNEVKIEEGDVTFATTLSGDWEPSQLAPLSRQIAVWLGVNLKQHVKSGEPGAALADPESSAQKSPGKPLMPRCRLTLRQIGMTWWASPDESLARLTGINVDATPIHTPGRDLTHYLLKLGSATGPKGLKLENLTMELIDAGDQQVVLTLQSDRAPLDLQP